MFFNDCQLYRLVGEENPATSDDHQTYSMKCTIQPKYSTFKLVFVRGQIKVGGGVDHSLGDKREGED